MNLLDQLDQFMLVQGGWTFAVAAIFATALAAIVWRIKLVLIKTLKINFSVFAVASALLAVCLGLLSAFIVSAYKSVYESFGAGLPMQTAWLFDFSYFLWMPLFLSVISWYPLRLNKSRDRYYLIYFLCEAVLLWAVLWALYSPVIQIRPIA